MKHVVMLVLGLLVAGMAFGQAVPPMNLQAEVMTAGDVELTWEEPPEGLVEDFEDGLAQGFEFFVGPGSYMIDGGFCKFDVVANTTDWGSGTYMNLAFDNFSCSTTIQYQVTQGYSTGLLFCGNGTQDADYEGYAVYISNTSYSAWYYVAGAPQNIIGWTTGVGINTGVGAVNTLQIDGSNGTFDITINGTYQGSFSDATYASGYVGMACAYTNETWFDDINCMFAANAPDAPAQMGELETVLRDDMGRVITNPDDYYVPGRAYDRFGESGNALEELLGYNIYRDGNLVGSVGMATLSYIDTMPTLNETYEYTVTAVYDPEGESSPAGPVVVTWEPVFFTLEGQITEIPAAGGSMFYDAHLLNTLPQTFSQGVFYKTYVTFPNGQNFGPLSQQPVVIPAFVNTTVSGLFLTLPAHAPAGDYVFTGRLGTNNMYVQDTVDFNKLAAATDNTYMSDPSAWAQNSTLAFEDLNTPVEVPVDYAMSAAYPNPFNPTTTISITMPEAADLSVVVYNVQGQKVATLAHGQINAGQHTFTFDANGLASGLYFVHAVVPGQMDQIRKVTLLR
ncbi:T9SS type A sorting domain-containing protein [bacterium]|nr:T9SS type A sorting domain-containing protein [bacterium]